MDLAFVLWMMVLLVSFPARYCHILMVYDATLRNFYYQHFAAIRHGMGLWSLIVFACIYLPLLLAPKGCIKR